MLRIRKIMHPEWVVEDTKTKVIVSGHPTRKEAVAQRKEMVKWGKTCLFYVGQVAMTRCGDRVCIIASKLHADPNLNAVEGSDRIWRYNTPSRLGLTTGTGGKPHLNDLVRIVK